MVTNKIKSQSEARKAILNGVEKVADAVTSTLGPGGRNVIIERGQGLPPVVTKDGVSVAKSIVLEDNFENMGAQMVIEVASKTNASCGDGTTTATLLAHSTYKNCVEAVEGGFEPMTVKRGILNALEKVKDLIREATIPVESDEAIRNVAKISANGDEKIGDMVSSIIKDTGKDGIVVVQESKSLDTTWSITKGVRLDSGFVSPYFANDPQGRCQATFENAWVLFYASKLTNVNELFPVLNLAHTKGHPLVIVAEDFDAEVVSTLVVNRLKTGLKVCAVKAPGVLEKIKLDFMTDAAIATGGSVISDDLGVKLPNVDESYLGKAKRIDINLTTTTFVDGEADKAVFDKRINELRDELGAEDTNDYQKHILKERIAKLIAGIGVVKVGGETASIIHEKRDRIDDAICATREAISGGIVAGAGVTLFDIGVKLLNGENKDDIGYKIVGNSLKFPLTRILDNAGYLHTDEAKDYIKKMEESTSSEGVVRRSGYDVREWKYHEDIVDAGVIDPANVTMSAVTNAVSVAALLISTGCMVGINPDNTPKIDLSGLNG